VKFSDIDYSRLSLHKLYIVLQLSIFGSRCQFNKFRSSLYVNITHWYSNCWLYNV